MDSVEKKEMMWSKISTGMSSRQVDLAVREATLLSILLGSTHYRQLDNFSFRLRTSLKYLSPIRFSKQPRPFEQQISKGTRRTELAEQSSLRSVGFIYIGGASD